MFETLARIERQHQSAVAAHAEARAKQYEISSRFTDTADRMQAITEKRISSGTSSEKDNAEYAALSGDLELLKKMHEAAKAATRLQFETMQACFDGYTEAERQHNLKQAELAFTAMHVKVKEIEKVFCQAIRALALQGQKLGKHTLSMSYSKGETLHRAIDLGVIPPEKFTS